MAVLALAIALAVTEAVTGENTPAAGDQPLVAEGFGAESIGGRGGRVIWVTNLDDSGPGSFRDAVTAEGPRIVRFKVGGIIRLADAIRVEHGRLTIDGASAADKGGITLYGHGIAFSGLACRDVIVRHLRVRRSPDDCIGVGAGAHRVLIDHCSVSWAEDENFGINKGHYVTVQWCIIAEGLLPHSSGMLVAHGANHVTLHHNFFTGNGQRNALLFGVGGIGSGGAQPGTYPGEKMAIFMPTALFDFRNNLVYDFTSGTELAEGLHANIVGNTYRFGPDDFPLVYPPVSGRGMPVHLMLSTFYPGSERPKIYCQGNVGPRRPRDEGDDWALVHVGGVSVPGKWGSDARYRSDRPFLVPPVATQTAAEAAELVLQDAGAQPRDDVDQRLIREYRAGTGAIGKGFRDWQRKHGD